MSWPLVKLGTLVAIKTGRLDANAADDEGIYPFFTCSRAPLRINTHAFDCDAILIAGNGDLNVKHYSGKFNAYQRTYVVTSLLDEILDTRYLFYFMDKYVERLRELSIGGVIKYIKLGMLTDAEIPLPPLSEQKRIAAILDKADAIGRKRQQAIQLADDFLRAVFLDMFGDPVTNPKGWEVKLLKDLSLKIHSGNTPKGGKENYVESGVVFLRSQNVWKRKIILDDVAYIDAATHRKMAGSSLRHQDILMTKTGRFNTENSSLGRAAMFFGEDNSANVNGHVYLIRLGGKVDKKFVLFILTMPEYYEYIRSVCVGGIDKRQLNKEHLESFPIIFPSADMQRRFSEILDVVDSAKAQAANALLSAEMMFDALSQKAFSGQL